MATVHDQGLEVHAGFHINTKDSETDDKAGAGVLLEDDVAHNHDQHDANHDQDPPSNGEPLTETVQGAMMAMQTRQTEIMAKVRPSTV